MLRSNQGGPWPLSILLPVLVWALAGEPVAAQGLVQITLEGALDREGGARVEVNVGARLPAGDREIDLGLHLARGTSGADLAGLLATRLERAGFDVLFPAPGTGAERAAHIFLEDALFVRLRAGHGLRATVTTPDAVPASVTIAPPHVRAEDARLVIGASTYSQHTKKRGLQTIELSLGAQDHVVQVAEKLHKVALEAGWVGFRPESKSWRPSKLKDAATPTGFSIEVDSDGDWRLEVELPERTARGG